ncbi:MAG: alpha/beta hydrolase [Pseudomonadota bacterium]
MQLDDAFANAAYIRQAADFPPRWAREAEAFRAGLGSRAALAISYGPSPRQAYDLFRSETEQRGTLVFVHGGYWLKFDRSSWSHLAQGALARGWNVAIPSYDLCPQVRIAEITDQIARAVSHIAKTSEGPISLTGHSAGGHLVSRMLAPGMLAPDVLGRIHSVAPISPVTDLRPLLQTSMNDAFRMDMSDAEAESPVVQPAPDRPVKIWVGADERPVFVEQAAALGAAWGMPHVVVPDRHHFDVIEALLDPDSEMVRFLTQD